MHWLSVIDFSKAALVKALGGLLAYLFRNVHSLTDIRSDYGHSAAAHAHGDADDGNDDTGVGIGGGGLTVRSLKPLPASSVLYVDNLVLQALVRL